MTIPAASSRPPSWTQHRGLLLLALPGVVYLFVFHYVPMAGLAIAFKNYIIGVGFVESPWIGWENFRRLFESPDFLRALRNTCMISALRLFFGFIAPIVLALMINELRAAVLRRFVQTVTYIPYIISWVILGGVFLLLFSMEGPVNRLLLLVREEPVSFLGEDGWFLALLVITGIWQSAGYGAVIYLAALAGISPTLYEAAVIDGANRWQQIRHITLPGLLPTIIVLLLLNLGHVLDAGFDQIYNLYNPLVYDVADILDTFMLRRLLNLDLGLATAAGLFKSLVGLILIVAANRLARRLTGGEQGLW